MYGKRGFSLLVVVRAAVDIVGCTVAASVGVSAVSVAVGVVVVAVVVFCSVAPLRPVPETSIEMVVPVTSPRGCTARGGVRSREMVETAVPS